MISRAKFSCGRARDILPAIEPHEHRRIARDFNQQVAKVSEREPAEQLDLSGRARQLALFERHHLGALHGAERTGDLAVAGGEVVVPEERHLLLQRTLRVHHPEQPALAGVLDVRVRRELAPSRRHADMVNLPDLRVHVVGLSFVVDEVVDDRRDLRVAERGEVRGRRAESRPSQQMRHLPVLSGHAVLRGTHSRWR